MTSRKNFKVLALVAVLLLAVVIALPACSKNKGGSTQASNVGARTDTTGAGGAAGGAAGAGGSRYGSADTTGTNAMTGAGGAPGATSKTGKSARGTRYGSEAAGQGGIPGIKITSPKNGETISGNEIKVKVKTSNFKLVDKEGQPAVTDEGHIHYYLDVAPPTTPGQPAMPKSGTFAPAVSESHTFTNVSPGSHVIGVQLINNDHTPVQPAVVDTIRVTVKGK